MRTWTLYAYHHGETIYEVTGDKLRHGEEVVVVEQRSHLRWVAFLSVLLGVVFTLLISCEGAHAHPGAWASHSTRQAGGAPRADTQRECEQLEHRHPRSFRKHRCKHKVYWDRKYRELPRAARTWLRITGNCETRGTPRYFASYRVNGRYDGRYQFDPYSTAPAAGFTLPPWRVYFREQDVRTWRWRWNPRSSGASEWPNCAAW